MTEDRKPETPSMAEVSPKFVDQAMDDQHLLDLEHQVLERISFLDRTEPGKDQTEEERVRLFDKLADVEVEIVEAPAHTAAGIAVKLRRLRTRHDPAAGGAAVSCAADAPFVCDDKGFQTALETLERLAGRGVTAVPASVTESEDAVVVLRQRWENVRAERVRAQLEIRDDNNPKDPGLIKDERLHDVQLDIEESIADTPTHTTAGIVAKLRQLQRNETEFDGDAPWRPAAFRTALEALGRNTMPAIEDPVIALKREWDARWERYKEEENRGDEEIIGPLHDRLNEAEFAIHRTPATTLAGIAVKLKMWTRNHPPGMVLDDWWKGPLDEFDDDLDELPIISALHDLERMAHATTVAETPPAEDAALLDALAEYDRLAAVEQALKHREDVFRPDTPEAKEANEAYQAACDKAMEAWAKVRAIPATTQAGLLARIQATDRYMTGLGEGEIYDTEWSVIKADVQRIVGETRP